MNTRFWNHFTNEGVILFQNNLKDVKIQIILIATTIFKQLKDYGHYVRLNNHLSFTQQKN